MAASTKLSTRIKEKHPEWEILSWSEFKEAFDLTECSKLVRASKGADPIPFIRVKDKEGRTAVVCVAKSSAEYIPSGTPVDKELKKRSQFVCVEYKDGRSPQWKLCVKGSGVNTSLPSKSHLRLWEVLSYKCSFSEPFYEKMPYHKALNTADWQRKRYQIIERDNFQCTNCGKPATEFVRENEGYWEAYEPLTNQERFTTSSNQNYDYVYIETIDQRYETHVHHKYYVWGQMPWAYPDDALVTLCGTCHLEVHQNNTIPIYSNWRRGNIDQLNYEPCIRCSGMGYFPEFRHVDNGICFRCHGNKYEELIPNIEELDLPF